ncbi:MAG: CapA family protein [Solirubrobacteraceae bacterium]
MAGAAHDPAIGLLGDVMLGRGVGAELRTRAPAELWDPELRDLVASLDAVVCNLECCVSERGSPTGLIAGKPFFFRAPPPAVGALRAIRAQAVTLANNHALDFGPDALADTLDALAAAGIAATGAGADRDAARRPAVIDVAGRSVGLVGVTDHPREYAATPAGWGVAHADLRHGLPWWLVRELAATRERCDLVIAFPHWGPNMTSRPAEWQRRAAAALQDAGADLVAGHSAHVFHGAGWTAAGPVLYDLGDVLDDYRVDPELRNDLGVLAIWRPQRAPAIELVGLRLHYARTALAHDADAEWIAVRLRSACAALGTRVTRLTEQRFGVAPA